MGQWLQVPPLRHQEQSKHRVRAGCCLAFSLSVLFCFPGVSVTSSNTGVPDISGSVYNKTQVRNAGPSSLVAPCLWVAWWDPARALAAGDSSQAAWSRGRQALAFLTLALLAGEDSRPLSCCLCHVHAWPKLLAQTQSSLHCHTLPHMCCGCK